jgi:hypothetical protein
MENNENKKEALRKKSLGELGELFAIKALVDKGFEKIQNLNDITMNFPFADLYAEKDGENYVISVKARNKYQKNGKENTSYNLGDNVALKAKKAEDEFNAKAYWMAIQFDEETYSIYFGSLEELEHKLIPISKCKDKRIGKCFRENIKHHFDFSFFKNT